MRCGGTHGHVDPISAINPIADLRATPGIVISRAITDSCTVIAGSIR
jgi:hypothetical protein